MLRTKNTHRLTRMGVGGAVSIAALTLVGCSTDTAGPETGTDVEDVQENAEEVEEDVNDAGEEMTEDGYNGPYDQSFYDDTESLDGQTVTVSANVNEIISDRGFTIAGTDNTTVDELLIIHSEDYPDLVPGLTVAVTGTVNYLFSIEEVEAGGFLGLDEDLYVEWENTPYIEADSVDLTVPTDPDAVEEE